MYVKSRKTYGIFGAFNIIPLTKQSHIFEQALKGNHSSTTEAQNFNGHHIQIWKQCKRPTCELSYEDRLQRFVAFNKYLEAKTNLLFNLQEE